MGYNYEGTNEATIFLCPKCEGLGAECVPMYNYNGELREFHVNTCRTCHGNKNITWIDVITNGFDINDLDEAI